MTHKRTGRRMPAPNVASALAEHARTLNHALQDHTGLDYPSDAYAIVGDLTQTARRLPQALNSIHGFLLGVASRRELRLDDGGDPARRVLAIGAALDEAAAHARALDDALNRVWGLLGNVAYQEQPAAPTVPDPDPDCRECHGTDRGWYQARDGEYVGTRCPVCRDGRVGR